MADRPDDLSWPDIAMSLSRNPYFVSVPTRSPEEIIHFRDLYPSSQEEIFGVAITDSDADGNVTVLIGDQGRAIPAQTTSKFPLVVEERAWDLLRDYMTAEQYFAFMEGTSIEITNKKKECRLILNRNGEFIMLQGPRGEGIVVLNGSKSNRIRSRDFPLGDEIATFIDWFRYKTEELIASWNCGVFSITKKAERR